MITKHKILKILADYSKKDIKNINEKSSLADDLGLDSLDKVELTMIFEEELNIKIDDGEINNVGDIFSYLEKR